MSIVDFLALGSIDYPVFNFATFSTNKKVVVIDLVDLCWFILELECFDEFQTSNFKINDSQVYQAVVVVSETKNSS